MHVFGADHLESVYELVFPFQYLFQNELLQKSLISSFPLSFQMWLQSTILSLSNTVSICVNYGLSINRSAQKGFCITS